MVNICVDPDDFDTDDTGRLILKLGCGLKHSADGATVDVEAWPFACDQTDNAQKVYCDPVTGLLTGPPVDKAFFVGDNTGTVSSALVTIASSGTRTATFDVTIDNTDGCATLIAQIDVQAIWDMTLNNVSDGYSVRLNREVDGGGFSTWAVVEKFQPTDDTGHHGTFAGEVIGRVDRVTVPAGDTTTIRYQTEITNDGISNIDSNRIGVRASGIAMTQHT